MNVCGPGNTAAAILVETRVVATFPNQPELQSLCQTWRLELLVSV